MGAQTTSEPADLTPSEVALARVLAAWEAWDDPGTDPADPMYAIGGALVAIGLWSGVQPTEDASALLARARKAGAL